DQDAAGALAVRQGEAGEGDPVGEREPGEEQEAAVVREQAAQPALTRGRRHRQQGRLRAAFEDRTAWLHKAFTMLNPGWPECGGRRRATMASAEPAGQPRRPPSGEGAEESPGSTGHGAR